jgi:hypothetical protein
MLLQVYSFLVLIYDIFCLIVMVIKAGTEAIFQVFFPPCQKSVAGEVVLVCKPQVFTPYVCKFR